MSHTYTTRDFNTTEAHAALQRQARAPHDLTRPGALSPERIVAYRAEACGLRVLYATQRVDDATLDALQALADESDAVAQLRATMSGAVMNRIEGCESENRRVLHFASRDVFDDLSAPFDTTGAADARDNARGELDKLRDFLARLDRGELTNARGEAFTDLINVGIGGSDLGPRALYLALQAHGRPERRVHFVSNVDPDDAAAVLRSVDLSRTLVNVVSKSGGTLETLTNETLVRQAFTDAGLHPARHFVCVTGQGSPMDNPQQYLASFYMFDYIGGRYSATSMVGGVPLGFALGYDGFLALLRGAREMDLAALEPNLRANPVLLLALLGIWNRNFLQRPTLAVLPYSQGLVRFAAHLQQLDMESNGKRVTRQGRPAAWATGPIVWGEPGTNGQHAFYQLIHQSEDVVPCEFLGFRHCQYDGDQTVQGTTSQEKLLANLLAQAVALATGQDSDNPNRVFPGNRPSSIIMADRLEPRTAGALLALYEAKVALQGFIWNINSFDQEGVQLGKVLANRLIGHFQAAHRGESAEQDDPVGWALMRAAGVV